MRGDGRPQQSGSPAAGADPDDLEDALRRLALDEGVDEFVVVQPRSDCEHVCAQRIHPRLLTNAPPGRQKCVECGDATEPWHCLGCGQVFCSRYVNGHMAEHATNESCSPVAGLGWNDLSFWCFACDDYIVSDKVTQVYRAFAAAKFQPPPVAGPATDLALDTAAQWIRDHPSARIVVITGAGVSTAAGIPDFRSPNSGLYDNLRRFNLPEPMAVFDIDFFVTNPRPFYQLAAELDPLTRNGVAPTRAHRLVKTLHDQGLLLRLYTQNIDGLDREAGLPEDVLVEAHGSFATASCIRRRCRTAMDMGAVRDAMAKERVPSCAKCGGFVKPDIVFFGEQLPDRFHELCRPDVAQADFVIVMGTSLSVMPVGALPDLVPHDTPRLLINRERVGSMGSRTGDLVALGDIEEKVSELVSLCGWG